MKLNRFVIFLILVAGVVYLRWPRFEESRIYVTRLNIEGPKMNVEYRASHQFSLALEHGTRLPLGLPTSSGPGWSLGPSWTPIQKKFHYFDARYDYWRGEYVAAVNYQLNSNSLQITCNNQEIELQPIISQSMNSFVWKHALPGSNFGDGDCVDLYLLNALPQLEEFLMVDIGKDVKRTER